MNKRYLLLSLLLFSSVFVVGCKTDTIKNDTYSLNIVAVTDIHGKYFDSIYVDKGVNEVSLSKVSTFLKQLRSNDPELIFIDNGDNIQGDNAAYYFNFVDTESEHIYSKLVEYLGVDVAVVGNHGVETGHDVYDKIRSEIEIPLLGANTQIVSGKNEGKPYYDEYTILKRNGLKVAVIGFTNPNIKSWLAPELYEGFDILSTQNAQVLVDKVIAKESPDVVIVAIHGGTGKGLESDFENPALYLAQTLKGIDFVVCGHDHSPVVKEVDNPNGKVILLNGGSHARYASHATITLEYKNDTLVSRNLCGENVKTAEFESDKEFNKAFQKEFEDVREFTNKKVCEITEDIDLGDVLEGPNKYIDLLHDIQLASTNAQISFAAPLGKSNIIKAGDLIYNDMFALYPFENQLYVISLTGKQVVDYLEYSYDNWINRNGPIYNYDSAKGINYNVHVSNPYGERVEVISMADGSPFELSQNYSIAMTSYRANGGGDLLKNGAKVDPTHAEEYIISKYPEIRDLLYQYFIEEKVVTPKGGDNWRFIK